MKLIVGQTPPIFRTEDVLGNIINLTKFKGKKIFIAFLRNTHCPLCSLHVYKLSQKAQKLKELGLEILVFYESEKKIFTYSDFFKKNIFNEQKFHVISDTQRIIYDLYGTEISPEKASFELLKKAGRIEQVTEANLLGIHGDGLEEGTHPDAIPADFLIDESFTIRYIHYGNDAGDNIDLKIVEDFVLNP
ncbi:hypothetical protein AD998_21090 [bacterium 336/3]|nr:hypothetical protein AD998_21090 [bacterium 336/3]